MKFRSKYAGVRYVSQKRTLIVTGTAQQTERHDVTVSKISVSQRGKKDALRLAVAVNLEETAIPGDYFTARLREILVHHEYSEFFESSR